MRATYSGFMASQLGVFISGMLDALLKWFVWLVIIVSEINIM
jgi:hypothetical protein